MNSTIKKLFITAVTALLSMTLGQAAIADRISLTDIEARLATIEDALYVPFKVQIGGGICNTAIVGSANPEITVSSNASIGTFTVTSVLVKTDDIPITGFRFLSLNSIVIDGTRYDTKTANLTGSSGGSGVLESFDILGASVALSTDLNDHTQGGHVPHQLVANSAGSNDIRFELFCRSDNENLGIASVAVSGWKRINETISVTYTPGN